MKKFSAPARFFSFQTTTSWPGFSVAPVLGARSSIRTMRAAAGARPAAEMWPPAGALARSARSCARAPPPVRRVSAFFVEASKKTRRPSRHTEPFDPGAPVERALTDGKHVLVAFDGDGARLFRTLAGPDLPALRLEPVVRNMIHAITSTRREAPLPDPNASSAAPARSPRAVSAAAAAAAADRPRAAPPRASGAAIPSPNPSSAASC